jgi:hypothetical protein
VDCRSCTERWRRVGRGRNAPCTRIRGLKRATALGIRSWISGKDGDLKTIRPVAAAVVVETSELGQTIFTVALPDIGEKIHASQPGVLLVQMRSEFPARDGGWPPTSITSAVLPRIALAACDGSSDDEGDLSLLSIAESITDKFVTRKCPTVLIVVEHLRLCVNPGVADLDERCRLCHINFSSRYALVILPVRIAQTRDHCPIEGLEPIIGAVTKRPGVFIGTISVEKLVGPSRAVAVHIPPPENRMLCAGLRRLTAGLG